jgi:ribosomal protein L11 methyltransferase
LLKTKARSWVRIDIACESQIADDLGAELADDFHAGIEFIADGIRIYLDAALYSDGGKERFEQIVASWGGRDALAAAISWSVEEIADEDWSENWKAHFKPLRVGRGFLICPTWEEARPGPRDRLIRIDPGMAFGTGHHETTRLCLEWLEDYARDTPEMSARSLLDVGTGSGILAMAGALLGFGKVVGVDNDPEAIAVALENTVLNDLAGKVEIVTGEAGDVSGSFDAVIANIQSLPLVAMAPVLAKRIVPGTGRIGLSGILSGQEPEVIAAFEKEGLRVRSLRAAAEWVLVDLETL